MSDARARRLVAEAVLGLARDAPRVLLAGVTHGDGVSTLAGILSELGPRVVLPLGEAATRDGPAFFEAGALAAGAGFAALPDAALRSLHGVVLVLRAEHSPRDAVAEVVAWARARGLPVLGVVWNEAPVLAAVGTPWRARLRGWFSRRRLAEG